MIKMSSNQRRRNVLEEGGEQVPTGRVGQSTKLSSLYNQDSAHVPAILQLNNLPYTTLFLPFILSRQQTFNQMIHMGVGGENQNKCSFLNIMLLIHTVKADDLFLIAHNFSPLSVSLSPFHFFSPLLLIHSSFLFGRGGYQGLNSVALNH